ncbi:MAG: peptide chain release factor N(5)-glutamine methyltransferase [Candidatus Fermentibacteraceae bacterium]
MNLHLLVKELTAIISGTDQPYREARLLAASLFGGDMAAMYRGYRTDVSPETAARLRLAAVRRARGEPIQHILGEAWFHGRRFICDERALVPRPETETLVDAVLAAGLPEKPRILDVGTGSGVIGITLALSLPGSAVTATDTSPAAAALARENARFLGALNYTVIETDLTAGLEGGFHAVVANPPYIPTGDIPGLMREVLFDPVTALDGGPSGLDCIGRLVYEAAGVLLPGGLLAIEIGCGQSRDVYAMLGNWSDVMVLDDLTGRPRVVTARRKP